MNDRAAISTDDVAQACAAGIRTLTQWAAGVRFEDLPVPVRARAARVLADDLGAMIGARDEPEVAAYHARVLAREARPEATMFRGGRARTDRLSAAVANAVAADWLELDEGYRVVPCHAGLYVVPALLAEAEARALPLRELLRALAVAYDVVTRVARAFAPRVLVLHSHARYGAVGASAATSLAQGVTADVMQAALTAAATLVTIGPRNHLIRGALVRNVWPAAGAWSGMMSVEWAQCGIAGAPEGFSDVYAGVLDSQTRPAALTEALGEQWAILDGYMKVFACCQHLHSAVEAVMAARPRVLAEGGVDAVQSIDVEAHALAQLLPNPRPETTLAGKFSLPHAVAATLVTGSGGADAFASSMLHEPSIARLRECVGITPYAPTPAPPNDRPARVHIHLHNGVTVNAECLSAQGGADRPFPPDVLEAKLAALTAPVYPRFVDVLSQVMALDGPRLDQPWPAIVADFCA
jgi:2-methylcitrate dehydratase PrpD